MIPRLFLGNFDFEYRLAEPTRESPAKLQRLNAELATAWLSIANDGDWIWTPLAIEATFFQQAVQQGLPHVIPVIALKDVPKGIECVPWGWSRDVLKLVTRFGWSANPPPEAVVRQANSRSLSEELERLWGCGLETARRIESLAALKMAIRSRDRSDEAWVVKAEFGMSARERILGRGPLTDADENWVRRRLDSCGVVFFEPWVERIGEIGIQIEIPKAAEPYLIGLTPMLVDRRGQYAGSWFGYDDSRFLAERNSWPEAIEVAIRAATHLKSIGYFGPVGIDAMVYRDRNGSCRLRALQDINARWSMGRLSLGWRELLEPGDEGYWQHGPATSPSIWTEFETKRIIPTSPFRVGDSDCQHQSQVLIRSRDN